MGRPATEGESPVSEREDCETVSRVPLDTRNPAGNRGAPPPSLHTTQTPTKEQYRDDTVKRTPGGE